jgi:DNA-binding MarR family transcriptional regulator
MVAPAMGWVRAMVGASNGRVPGEARPRYALRGPRAPNPRPQPPTPAAISIYFCAILACVQATQTAGATDQAAAATVQPTATATNILAGDLYAVIVFLHKNCNADLFEAVGALELSLSQIKLLHHLEDASREISLTEAAELVHVSMPAASRMVDDLVRRDFIHRREDETDRRMKRVCLTDGGRTAIRRLNAARLSGLEQFAGDLSTTERDALAQALQQLLEREDIAACRPEGLTK